ncbi:polysaccharide deacetylase family protein [Ferrimonas sp. SCSIO 43195]|uniref:polysaccharide deacetylase family protein n=1 Tax=Ferrimonas sp. SCSIO 43195 TaxID=2822844 RepID=UPI0020765633|nr:polysaccharide deacetylase family protein [Ferrimonas sp. SCSIO 43195]USD38676.1 polysaccharide deacetylase family protein [Ferrimonas sp. SCSIO 43195]
MKIITFDIEDWFHILDNSSTQSVDSWSGFESRLEEGVDRIIGLLSEKNQKATFFCLGWVAENYPGVIRKISNSGHEIGSHSYAHQLAYQQDRKQFGYDLKKSIELLEDAVGKKVISYRAPGFSITESNLWAFEALAENGIEIDSSVFPAKRAHGGLSSVNLDRPFLIESNGYKLKEFPINTRQILGKQFIYSGGGYFRLFPKFYLERAFSSDSYVMTYFHPRDFDSNQPVLSGLNAIRRFKSYVGISGAFGKLSKIMDENEFVSLGEAAKMVDWETVQELSF